MKRNKAVLYMMLTALLWSTGGILIKLVDWHPMAIAGIRSGIAAVTVLPIVPFNKSLISKRRLIGALFYSLTLILFVSANKLTTSANAIFLQFTAPIWVVLFSKLFINIKIRRSDTITIVVIFMGMALFFLDNLNSGKLLGNILGLMSGITFAGMTIALKQQAKESPISTVFIGNFMNFLICIPFYFISMPSSKSILGLILLGVFQVGFSYILYTKAIDHLTVIEATLIPIIEPLLNPIWVIIFVGEIPKAKAIIGGIIVILSMIIRGVYQSSAPIPE